MIREGEQWEAWFLRGGAMPAIMPDFEIPEEVLQEATTSKEFIKRQLEALGEAAQNDDGFTRESLYAYLSALNGAYYALTGDLKDLYGPALMKTIKAQVIDESKLRKAQNAFDEESDLF